MKLSKDYRHYLNGKWVATENLKISAFDLAVLRGYGVFDAMRTFNRKLPRLEANISRFLRSAEMLKLTVPCSAEQLAQLIADGIKRNPGELSVRPVLTGGVGPDPMTPGKPSLMILFSAAAWPSPEQLKKGVKVITWPARRWQPEAKTLDYLMAIKADLQARQVGAIDAIYTDPEGSQRQVYEGAHTNVFIVKSGRVITPKEGILFGVTREIVLELAAELKLMPTQQPLRLGEVLNADEVFITGTSKGVLPVVQVDKHKIGNGLPGPITKQLIQAFKGLTDSL